MVHLAGAGAMGPRLASRLQMFGELCSRGAVLLYRRLSLRCSWWRPRGARSTNESGARVQFRAGMETRPAVARPWLRFDGQRPCRALCAFISTGDTSIMDSVWCSVGYKRTCKGSLEAHKVSAGHKAAIDIVKTRESNAKGMAMPTGLAGAAEAPFLS